MEFILLLLFCVIFAVIGYNLGKAKGNEAAGGLLGAVFGPIGWVVVLLMADKNGGRPITSNTVDMRRNYNYGYTPPSAERKAKEDAWKKAQSGE